MDEVIKICKYCKKKLIFNNPQQFGAHVVNCICNPNKYIIRQKIIDTKLKKSTRKKYIFKCKKCEKEYELFLTDYKYKTGQYRKHCSRSCASKKNKILCIYCKKNYVKSKLNKFCSKKCFFEYEYNKRIIKWKAGELSGNRGDGISNYVRKYIFDKYHNKCVECGWSVINKHTGKIPLHVHHKDGNYRNTVEENLTLLCPNCHSLTESYGIGNKGNGREGRRKWRYEKKHKKRW